MPSNPTPSASAANPPPPSTTPRFNQWHNTFPPIRPTAKTRASKRPRDRDDAPSQETRAGKSIARRVADNGVMNWDAWDMDAWKGMNAGFDIDNERTDEQEAPETDTTMVMPSNPITQDRSNWLVPQVVKIGAVVAASQITCVYGRIVSIGKIFHCKPKGTDPSPVLHTFIVKDDTGLALVKCYASTPEREQELAGISLNAVVKVQASQTYHTHRSPSSFTPGPTYVSQQQRRHTHTQPQIEFRITKKDPSAMFERVGEGIVNVGAAVGTGGGRRVSVKDICLGDGGEGGGDIVLLGLVVKIRPPAEDMGHDRPVKLENRNGNGELGRRPWVVTMADETGSVEFCLWDDRWCRDWIPSSTVLSISNPKRTTFRGLIQLTPSATTIVDVLEGVCDASESLKAALAFVEGCDVLEEDGEDVV